MIVLASSGDDAEAIEASAAVLCAVSLARGFQMATETLPPLNLQVTCDASRVAEVAAAMRARMPKDQWETLAALAAEILALREAETGARVLVVSADQQSAEVARALRAPLAAVAGLPKR